MFYLKRSLGRFHTLIPINLQLLQPHVLNTFKDFSLIMNIYRSNLKISLKFLSYYFVCMNFKGVVTYVEVQRQFYGVSFKLYVGSAD